MEILQESNNKELAFYWSCLLQNSHEQIRSIGVGNGLSGIVIYFLYRYHKNRSEQDRLLIVRLLQNIVSNIEQGFSMNIVELTELLYTLDICKELADGDIDVNSLRRYLRQTITQCAYALLDQQQYDPYTGGFFPAYYLLHQTSDTKLARDCLALLKERTELLSNDSGYFDSLFVKGKLCLGITHGLAFYLNYLCAAYRKGIRKRDCLFLLELYFNFLYSQHQSFDGKHCFFPDYVGEDVNSRLCLCYGDAGILFSLLQAAYVLKSKKHQYLILNMLDRTQLRTSVEYTGIHDDSLLYGSSGIYLYFQKIYRLTGYEKFRLSAHYWKRRSMDYSFARLRSYSDSRVAAVEGMNRDISFQEGLTGALTVYSCCTTEEFEALEFFFYLK